MVIQLILVKFHRKLCRERSFALPSCFGLSGHTAEPQISHINKLYEEGHEITYWTARGTTTGIDWRLLTEQQLAEWGCKYHHLSVGEKPNYDILICDKAINSESFFKSRGIHVK